MSGWIKLHRKIRDNWVWDSDEPFDKRSAWIDLLMLVNYEARTIPFNSETMTIKPGQRLTSIAKLSTRWGWTQARTSKFLNELESTGMISTDRGANGTVINVENWAFYQVDESANNGTNIGANMGANNGANRGQYKNKEDRRKKYNNARERTYDMQELELRLLNTN